MQSFKVSTSFAFCITEEAGSHKYIARANVEANDEAGFLCAQWDGTSCSA